MIPMLLFVLCCCLFFPRQFSLGGLRYKFKEQPPVAPAPWRSRNESSWRRVLVLVVFAVAVVLLAHTYADAQCSMCRRA
jgi:hypothetical protein